MQKRILSLLVVSAVLLATGCSKSESNVSSTPRSAAESTTTSASDIEDEPAVSASSTETSSEEPAKMENDPTEESVQDNALLSMDAQELFVAASEIRGKDASEDRIRTYTYETLPQEDGTVAVVRTSVIAGFPENVSAYFLTYGDSGLELKSSKLGYTFNEINGKIDGYTAPVIDYNDPRSTIDVDGLSAEELADITDVIFNAFYYASLGECENGKMSGICSYNGDNSYEWVEKMFKKFYTDDMYNRFFNEETLTLMGAYSNEDGVCVKAALAFGGPVPSVVGYEMLSSDDNDIVFRTKVYSEMSDTEWYVVSSLTNTENGWKISCYNEDE